jgi:hypothetical protein
MTDAKQSALSDITRTVMSIVDSWGLQVAEMQRLLDLPENVRARAFNKFREGQASLPDDPSVLRRAQYVIRIGDALRTTYPLNPRMGERWVRQRHRRFGGRTPLAIILGDGESGMIAVLSELDCTFSWDLTGSKPHRTAQA